jgi:hypothetical protein
MNVSSYQLLLRRSYGDEILLTVDGFLTRRKWMNYFLVNLQPRQNVCHNDAASAAGSTSPVSMASVVASAHRPRHEPHFFNAGIRGQIFTPLITP